MQIHQAGRKAIAASRLRSERRLLAALLVAAWCAGNANITMAADGVAAAVKESPAAAQATPEQIRLGQKLFEGSVRFAGGGPACNACHHVEHEAVAAGATLAADLTHSFARMGGEGLGEMLVNAPFPVMQTAYEAKEGKALTAAEVTAITGFLQQADKESIAPARDSHGTTLLYGGAGGVIVLAGLFSLIGRGRKKRSVNQDIYDRQIKSE